MSDIDPAVVFPVPLLQPAAPTPRPNAQPPRAPNWRRMIVDHNPFFLLSALCMLGGSVAVTNSLSWSPVRLERILWLTATINVYELLLVGLAAFLIRRPASRRDGSILLIIEAFFLCDVAFLDAELFAIDRWVGLFANLIVFTLAIVKLTVIGRALGLRLLGRELGVATSLIVLIHALPGVLKFYATSRGGTLPALAMLSVWWAIFAIGVTLHTLLNRPRGTLALHWFSPLLSIVGGLSLLAHAGTSQWIYDQHFWGADLAPTLALAAFVRCSRRGLRQFGLLFAGAAVFASTSYGRYLQVSMLDRAITPVHLTVGVVYFVLAWTLARRFFLWFVGVGMVAIATALFGPSIATIRMSASLVIDWIDDVLEAMRPKTAAQWGVISIVSSFALLIVGTVISVRRVEAAAERST